MRRSPSSPAAASSRRSSTTRTSHGGTGRPSCVPSFSVGSRGVAETPIPHSVIPQDGHTKQSNSLLARPTRALGIGAPGMAMSRQDGGRAPVRSACSTRSCRKVGAAIMVVAPSQVAALAASAGDHRSRKTAVPPRCADMSTPHRKPEWCPTGEGMRFTTGSPKAWAPTNSTQLRSTVSSVSWVFITPFGSPVVPEVKPMCTTDPASTAEG
jgi:hypothetical protein